MDVTRRDFFKVTGVGFGALLAGGGCHELRRGIPHTYSLEKPPAPGEEDWKKGEIIYVKTICRQCPAGCGILVKIEEARALQAKGNVSYPVNSGGIGPKGLSSPQTLYDPYRIKGPMKKNAQGGFDSIPWKQAISEVAEKLKALRKKGAHQLAILSGEDQTITADLLKRFTQAYGSPNFLNGSHGEEAPLHMATKLALGMEEMPVVDWKNTALVYSFGTALYDSYCQSVYLSQGLRELRYGRKSGSRAPLIHFDIQYSRTAAEADSWYSVNPGTYGLLALGMCRSIIDNKLHNEDFIKNHTSGFEAFLKLIKKDEYSPASVAKICGIKADLLGKLAYDFAKLTPSVALTDSRGTSMTNGLYTALAVSALNALVGNYGINGGLFFKEKAPLAEWPACIEDEEAKKGKAFPRMDGIGTEIPFSLSAPGALVDAVETGKPYTPEALLLYYSDPAYSKTNSKRYKKALEKIPFKISFSPFPDDSTLLCDYILPDHSFLERWDLHTGYPNVGYSVVGLQRPVLVDIKAWRDGEAVIPTYKLYDTAATGDVIIQIAREMGGSMKESFSGQDKEKEIYIFDEVSERKGKKSIFPSTKGAAWYRLQGLMESARGSIKEKDSLEDFAAKFVQEGFWSQTPLPMDEQKKKIHYDFFLTRMKTALENIVAHLSKEKKTLKELLKKWKIEAEGDTVYLPHFEAPQFAGSEKDYPFHLYAYKPMTYAYGSGANLPWLQEIKGKANRAWSSYLEISPKTAKKLGISDGQKVRLESPVGSLEPLEVVFYSGLPENMVAVAKGKGHHSKNPLADLGVNVNEILADNQDPLTGSPATLSTRVRIVKL